MITPIAKKEALFMLTLIQESVALYVTKSITKESTDSMNLDIPTAIDIAETIDS